MPDGEARSTAVLTHAAKVARIAEEVRARTPSDGPASLSKSAVSHFVPNPNDPRHRDQKIDVRNLDQILEIDAARQRCVAEPGVTFYDLVQRTLPLGLVPKLVPELKTITLGGAVAGCSVESMSFRYGGFHDSCLRYEIVTGAGDVVECSRDERPLVFDMIHGSYGTLGILTRLEFELVPAKPYVHLEYRRFRSFEPFQREMMARCRAGDVDFIDAIVHAPDCFVLCLGRFAESAPYTSDYSLEIYYQSTRARHDDYLRTVDYFFRYDTECHWLSRTVPGLERPWVRKMFGKALLGSTNMLNLSKRFGGVLERMLPPNVVVDVFIPEPNFERFFRWYAERLDYYPLWLVPYRVDKPYPWIADAHARKAPCEFFVDCAVYGKRNDEAGVNYYRLLEDKTRELGGIKTLISKNFYDRSTFWSIYDRERYQQVKRQTDPRNLFRDLYDKFHFDAVQRTDAGEPRRTSTTTSEPSARV